MREGAGREVEHHQAVDARVVLLDERGGGGAAVPDEDQHRGALLEHDVEVGGGGVVGQQDSSTNQGAVLALEEQGLVEDAVVLPGDRGSASAGGERADQEQTGQQTARDTQHGRAVRGRLSLDARHHGRELRSGDRADDAAAEEEGVPQQLGFKLVYSIHDLQYTKVVRGF